MAFTKVEICGVNTSELCVLNDDEKRELLVKSQGGDSGARQRLICGNLKLVLSVIQKFIGKKDNSDDIFQVGCIGLVKAVDNFNTALDVKFSTYAVPMIIGEIKRYLRDNNAIRVSRSIRDLAYRALVAREELQTDKDREITVSEIAQRLGEKKESIAMAMEAIVDPISIYEPIYNDSGDSLYVIDQLCDNSTADDTWLEKIALKEALKKLSKRERKIIAMRYYQNKTQVEIAQHLKISQAQVSRIERGALKKLKKNMS